MNLSSKLHCRSLLATGFLALPLFLSTSTRAEPNEVRATFRSNGTTLTRSINQAGWNIIPKVGRGGYSVVATHATSGTSDFHLFFRDRMGYTIEAIPAKSSTGLPLTMGTLFPYASFAPESQVGSDLSPRSVLSFDKSETGSLVALKIVEFKLSAPGQPIEQTYLRFLITEKGEAVPIGFSSASLITFVSDHAESGFDVERALKQALFTSAKKSDGTIVVQSANLDDLRIEIKDETITLSTRSAANADELWTRAEDITGGALAKNRTWIAAGARQPERKLWVLHPSSLSIRSTPPSHTEYDLIRAFEIGPSSAPVSPGSHVKVPFTVKHAYDTPAVAKLMHALVRIQNEQLIDPSALLPKSIDLIWSPKTEANLEALFQLYAHEVYSNYGLRGNSAFLIDLDRVGDQHGLFFDELATLQNTSSNALIAVKKGNSIRITAIAPKAHPGFLRFAFADGCSGLLRSIGKPN